MPQEWPPWESPTPKGPVFAVAPPEFFQSLPRLPAMYTYDERPRVLPSLIHLTLQLLAIAQMVCSVFWLNSRTMQTNSTIWALRITTMVFLLVNCTIVRFMKSDVIAWAGMAMNAMPITLISVLLKGAISRPPAHHPMAYRPSEKAMCITMLALVCSTLLLQIIFKLIHRGEEAWSICSGDLTSHQMDDHDYLEIDGELLELPDVRPEVSLHTRCSGGVVLCWFMRILSVLFLPLAMGFFLIGIGIHMNATERNDPPVRIAKQSIAEQNLQQAIALVIFGLFALFSSFRFSSRRRLLVIVLLAVGFLIYTIFQYLIVRQIADSVPNIGALLSGFFWISVAITAGWTACAAFLLRQSQLFDNSCCVCFKLDFEQLGHCVVF